MAITAADFPAARIKRAGGRQTAPDPNTSAPPLPRTRLFPFALHQAAGSRSTVSTPVLKGQIIIHGISWRVGTVSDPPAATLELGWSPVVCTETSVPLATNRPYTTLTELLDPHNIVPNDRGAGFPETTLNSPQMGTYVPLKLIVSATEAAICMADVNPSGFVQDHYGFIHVTENLSEDQIATFL